MMFYFYVMVREHLARLGENKAPGTDAWDHRL